MTARAADGPGEFPGPGQRSPSRRRGSRIRRDRAAGWPTGCTAPPASLKASRPGPDRDHRHRPAWATAACPDTVPGQGRTHDPARLAAAHHRPQPALTHNPPSRRPAPDTPTPDLLPHRARPAPTPELINMHPAPTPKITPQAQRTQHSPNTTAQAHNPNHPDHKINKHIKINTPGAGTTPTNDQG